MGNPCQKIKRKYHRSCRRGGLSCSPIGEDANAGTQKINRAQVHPKRRGRKSEIQWRHTAAEPPAGKQVGKIENAEWSD
jgi:hypothetical protein